MYFCSDIGAQHVLCYWLLKNTPYLILDMCFAAADAAFHTDSQISALECVYCQNLHVNTTLTTITSNYTRKCSIYGKNWYENQVVSGNPLELLGIKIVLQWLYVPNLPNAKTTTTGEKLHYDEISDKFPGVFQEPAVPPNQPIKHEIQLKNPT